jgi:hypothetical protein
MSHVPVVRAISTSTAMGSCPDGQAQNRHEGKAVGLSSHFLKFELWMLRIKEVTDISNLNATLCIWCRI